MRDSTMLAISPWRREKAAVLGGLLQALDSGLANEKQCIQAQINRFRVAMERIHLERDPELCRIGDRMIDTLDLFITVCARSRACNDRLSFLYLQQLTKIEMNETVFAAERHAQTNGALERRHDN